VKQGPSFSHLASRVVSGLAAGGLSAGGGAAPGGLVVCPGGGRDFGALAWLEFFRLAQSKHPPCDQNPWCVCQLLLIATSGAAVVGMAADLAAAVVPVSGAAICAWLLLQPVTAPSPILPPQSSGCLSGFFPAIGCGCVTSATACWPPTGRASAGRPAQAMALHPAGLPAVVATVIGSYVDGRPSRPHPLSPISPGKDD